MRGGLKSRALPFQFLASAFLAALARPGCRGRRRPVSFSEAREESCLVSKAGEGEEATSCVVSLGSGPHRGGPLMTLPNLGLENLLGGE